MMKHVSSINIRSVFPSRLDRLPDDELMAMYVSSHLSAGGNLAQHQADYRAAVAASFDGTQIIAAQHVMLFDDKKSPLIRLYLADCFLTDKLDIAVHAVCPSQSREIKTVRAPQSMEGFLKTSKSGEPSPARKFVLDLHSQVAQPMQSVVETNDGVKIFVSHVFASGGFSFPSYKHKKVP